MPWSLAFIIWVWHYYTWILMCQIPEIRNDSYIIQIAPCCLRKLNLMDVAGFWSDLSHKILRCHISLSVTPIPAHFSFQFCNCRVRPSCERENAPQHPSSFHCGPQHEGCQVRRLPGHCAFWTTGCHLSRFVCCTVAGSSECEDIPEDTFIGQSWQKF